MGPRFHRNRQECLQDLFPLRRLTVDGDGPTLIIGDGKEQSTGFRSSYRSCKLRVPPAVQVERRLGQAVINLDHGPGREAVNSCRKSLPGLSRCQGDPAPLRKISHFQQVSPVHIAEILFSRWQGGLDILYLFILDIYIIFPGHIRGEGTPGSGNLCLHRHQDIVGSQKQAQIILHLRRILHLILPVVRQIVRKDKAQRQGIQILIQVGPSALLDVIDQIRIGNIFRIQGIADRQQAVHQWGAPSDAVCIGGGLAAHALEKLRQICVCSGGKQGYRRKIHPCSVIFCLSRFFLHPIKVLRRLQLLHQSLHLFIIPGVSLPAGGGDAGDCGIDGRLHSHQGQSQKRRQFSSSLLI